jgi:membrane protease YdiL (CAAX protease family)
LDHFKRWFPVGIGMMIIVYLIDFGFGVLEPRDNWTIGYQAQKIGLGLIGALLIGFMEETFFRGFVFRTFYSVMRPAFAVVFSSLFFAYLHFKMADEVMAHIPTSEIGIDDGLFAIWGSVTAFTTGFDAVLFFNLALVGVLLHLAFLYTRNLWACVGLHAGWVFVIQSLVKTIDETEDAHAFFGTEKVADGYLVSFFLVGFVLLFMWLIRTRNSQSSILA